MKNLTSLLIASAIFVSCLVAQDSTKGFSSLGRFPDLIFTNSASLLPWDAVDIRAGQLIFTNDDRTFRGSLLVNFRGRAQLEYGNDGAIASETGLVKQLTMVGAKLGLLGHAERWPAISLNARSTLQWIPVRYDQTTVKREIGYLAEKGMESFSYDYKYVYAGVTVSHRFEETFEFSVGAGLQQFQLRNTRIFLTVPAPSEEYYQAGMIRINGITGFCGASADLTSNLTVLGEIDLLPEPTPVVESVKFEVDRTLRVALGARFYPSAHIGFVSSIYELIPTYGVSVIEARMGVDLFFHKSPPN